MTTTWDKNVDNVHVVNEKGIYGFFREFRFLSNFEMVDVVYDGITYPSVEHAFQAAKTLDHAERLRIAALETPAEAKKAGRKVQLREDWEEVKLEVMLECTRNKYTDPDLREMLLATEDLYLEETNWWHDRYWGVSWGEGENNLGKILMQVRNELGE